MRHTLLFIAFIFVPLVCVYAQKKETSADLPLSPDTATVDYVFLNQRWPGEELRWLADTSLTGFHYYLPTESNSSLNLLNGNAGLAYKSMVFKPDLEPGFRFAPSVYTDYLLKNTSIPYYHIHGPYTRIFYNTGKAKEQIFNVTHAQNLSRGITLGIDLRIINSLGLYLRQKSNNSSVAVQAQFVSDNEHYVVLANYRNNRLRWRENGGIADDTLFTGNVETDRQRIDVRLASAENLIKESGVFVRQFYYIGKKTGRNKLLSETGDSTEQIVLSDTARRYYDPLRTNFFRYTFSYTRNSLRYQDANPLSGYYTTIYSDSTATFDSLYYHEFSNDFAFEGGLGRARGGNGKALLLRAGIEYNVLVFHNDTIASRYIRVTPYAYLSANAFGIARAEGQVWLTQGSPTNGDKGISAKLSLPAFDNSSSWGNLSGVIALNALQPDFLYQNYYSNNFQWNNAFGQQTIFSIKGMYDRRHVKAGFNFYNLSGWVYLNEESVPAREDKSFSVSQAWGQTDIEAGQFDLQAFVVFQKSGNTGVLRLPEVAGRVTGCFNTPLFKRAMYIRLGLSLMYNSAFYADAYMPALRSYYIQNEVKTGNYPYIDGFLNFRVKRARMYLLMKNMFGGLLGGYTYFMVPGYPMPDRGLRFGVSWTFYD